jgi:hypothetical protein
MTKQAVNDSEDKPLTEEEEALLAEILAAEEGKVEVEVEDENAPLTAEEEKELSFIQQLEQQKQEPVYVRDPSNILADYEDDSEDIIAMQKELYEQEKNKETFSSERFLQSVVKSAVTFHEDGVIPALLQNNTLRDVAFPTKKTISNASDEELLQLTKEDLYKDAAEEELNKRQYVQQMSFMESLQIPEAQERLGKLLMSSPGQLVAGVTEGLPALGRLAIEESTGIDMDVKEAFDRTKARMEEVYRSFDVSAPLNPQESLMENAVAALGGSGLLTRFGLVGTDMLIDQSIREISERPGEKYQTMFDRIRMTDNNREKPIVTNPLVLVAAAAVGGVLTTSAVANLTRKTLPAMEPRLITETDPTAPKGLYTVESSKDQLKAFLVDEQKALGDILKKSGLPDWEKITTRIDFDTHSAAQVKIQEAIQTGYLNFHGTEFKVKTSPTAFYTAYHRLQPNIKKDVSRYLILKDQYDDVKLLVDAGQADPKRLSAIAKEARLLEKATPTVKEFSTRYQDIIRGLRDVLERDMISGKYRKHVDTVRQHYVPVEISKVDESEPFFTRLHQARNQGSYSENLSFMNTRSLDNVGNPNRVDPVDALIQSTESTLNAMMKNDVKLAVVDSLLESATVKNGKPTIRKATPEDLEKGVGNRAVEVYRNGEKEIYITSAMTANLLKFDPYIAKHPFFFSFKRMKEHAAVGPATMLTGAPFAFITAMRDTVGGNILREAGAPKVVLGDITNAVGSQMYGKMTKEISNFFLQHAVRGKDSLLAKVIPPEQQQKLADITADAYARSFYHQANMTGSSNASLMQHKIKLSRGRIDEIRRTVRNMVKNSPVAPLTRRVSDTVEGLIKLLTFAFDSVQEAPRYASAMKRVAAGEDIQSAVKGGKSITGDTTRSGRVFDPQGKMIPADIAKPGLLSNITPAIGYGGNFLRESAEFINPMIQGNRKLLNKIIDEPTDFLAKAWMNGGLITLGFMGWNEMLGREYNDHMMMERSASDVVLYNKVGIPGMSPEQGIEVPIMHEVLSFSSPFARAVYSMIRSEDGEKTRAALAILGENILKNSLDSGSPVVGQVAANMMGVNLPGSLLYGDGKGYAITEDDVGVLPQNIEKTFRSLFAGVADTGIYLLNSMQGQADFDTFYTALSEKAESKAPFVKNVAGYRVGNTQFSTTGSEMFAKSQALKKFREVYDTVLNPKRELGDGVRMINEKGYHTKFYVENPLQEEDIPPIVPGPSAIDIKNPLYELVGEIIRSTAYGKKEGMSALDSRDRNYGTMLKKLKQYNAGDRNAFMEWKASLNGLAPMSDEAAIVQEIIDSNGIDLSTLAGRKKFEGVINRRRLDVLEAKSDTIKRIEKAVTEFLKQQGKDFKFDMSKHLNPHDPNPGGVFD